MRFTKEEIEGLAERIAEYPKDEEFV